MKMEKLTEKQIKEFWEKKIVPFLQEDEEKWVNLSDCKKKWEDLPEYEKKEIAKMAEDYRKRRPRAEWLAFRELSSQSDECKNK